MKRIVIIAVSLLFLTSCASFPDPKTENGTYTNYKYEFAIDIPDGWDVKNEYPAYFKRVMPYENRQYTTLLLFNNKTNAMIIIENTKTFMSYDLYALYRDSAIKGVEDICKARKKIMDGHKYCKNYNYEILDIDHWIERVDFSPETQELKMINNCYFYGCHKDDMCLVDVILISNADTFNVNMATYNQILDSLRRGL